MKPLEPAAVVLNCTLHNLQHPGREAAGTVVSIQGMALLQTFFYSHNLLNHKHLLLSFSHFYLLTLLAYCEVVFAREVMAERGVGYCRKSM